jgi:membrane protease YdiL (CAAX protease family)
MKQLISFIKISKSEIPVSVLLLSAPVLLTVYWYYGNATVIGSLRPTGLNEISAGYLSYLGQFLSFFILLFVLPALYIKLYLKQPLKNYGLQSGDSSFGLKFVLISVPFIVTPLIYIASFQADIRQEYPLLKLLHSYKDWILYYELIYVIFYYFAWEFYFRGFLLFGLEKHFGPMNAILIQTISSCLIHLGKPDGEIFGSIIAGIIFGAISLRTRSFIYVFIIHAVIGVLTDIFVLM